MRRCNWVNLKNPRYIAYHDEEWGRPCHDEHALYEWFILETFQAGLSWELILNKREHFRQAFDGFDIRKVAAFDAAKIDALMQDAGIIRQRRKLEAAVTNSLHILELQQEFGSFDAYIWGFTARKSRTEPYTERVSSPLSDAVAKDLKKRGFRFIGSKTIYAFLQGIGVLQAHGPECDWYSAGNSENIFTAAANLSRPSL